MKEEDSYKDSEAQIVEELTKLLGHAPVDWSAEILTHNTNNAVTAGIWRVRFGSASVVLKVLSPSGTASSGEWSPSEMPSHWNYWEREVLAYESGVTAVYSAARISGPRLLDSNRRPNAEVALWLEDARRNCAVPGTRWGLGTSGVSPIVSVLPRVGSPLGGWAPIIRCSPGASCATTSSPSA